MRTFNLVIALFICLYNGMAYSEIYRCNVNGSHIFTDKPCDGEKIELNITNTSQSDNSFDSDKDRDNHYLSSHWYADYSGYLKALSLGEHLNVPVLIYFQADWCRYCRQLERELFDTHEGRKVLQKVIKVRVTPENGDKEHRIFKELGGKGYPTVLVKKPSIDKPKRLRLMRKLNEQWVAKPASYLSKVIE